MIDVTINPDFYHYDKCALNYSWNSTRTAVQKSLGIFVFDIYFPTCGDDVVMAIKARKRERHGRIFQ